MADKLDWLNNHLVLIRYLAVGDVVVKENYKIPPDQAEYFVGVSSTEEMVFKLAGQGNFKTACEFLAYIAHRRAALWWGYRCVLSLMEELRENPAVERDIADIAANFETTVPDWAKVELPKPPDPAPMLAMLKDLRIQNKQMRAVVDPGILKYVEDSVEVAFREFKNIHGIHPMELIKKLGERINEDRYAIDPNSPVFKAEAELKTKLMAVQKEAVDTIKSVIPSKVPAHQKMLQDNALAAVYRWIAAPDPENSQTCLDVGNECPDTPAGLLSLSAFWAYGNLMPMGDQTVPTPPGLAANGLCQVLLLSALHKGGTRKVKERYEEYFRLGVEVLIGADNWEASLAAGKAPHEETPPIDLQAPVPLPAPPAPDPPGAAPPASTPVAENSDHAEPSAGNGTSPAPSYKRWKPNGGTE